VPQWRLAEASYAASWLQPLSTMAQAKEMSEIQFLQHLDKSTGFPSIKIVKDSLAKIGYKGGLSCAFEAFQNATEKEIRRQSAKLPPNMIGQERAEPIWSISKRVRESFRWQRFLSKGVLKQYATDFVTAVAKSQLPFVEYYTK